jgi:hypothetical protein
MQTIYYGLGAIGLVLGGIWAVVEGALWLDRRFASIESKLDLIMSNHIPHLEARLENIERRVG